MRRTGRVNSSDKLFRMLVALLRNEESFLKPSEYNAHSDMKETFVSLLYFGVKVEMHSFFF